MLKKIFYKKNNWIKVYAAKKNIKEIDFVITSLRIIKAIDEESWKNLKKINKIFILDSKNFNTMACYKSDKAILITTEDIKNSTAIDQAAGIIHEAKHAVQPIYKDGEENYYLSEIDATNSEMIFYKKIRDFDSLDIVNPKKGRKKYFEEQKKRQDKFEKKEIEKVYEVQEDRSDWDYFEKIIDGVLDKKIEEINLEK